MDNTETDFPAPADPANPGWCIGCNPDNCIGCGNGLPDARPSESDIADARIDRAYVAGAQAGFALGNAGDNEGLRKLCDSRAEAVAVFRAA
jgi:hypothetical protein